MAVELKNRLDNATDKESAVDVDFHYPTLETLGTYPAEQLLAVDDKKQDQPAEQR